MSCDRLHARLALITPGGNHDRDAWRQFDEIFEEMLAGPMSLADQRAVWALIERAPECDNERARSRSKKDEGKGTGKGGSATARTPTPSAGRRSRRRRPDR